MPPSVTSSDRSPFLPDVIDHCNTKAIAWFYLQHLLVVIETRRTCLSDSSWKWFVQISEFLPMESVLLIANTRVPSAPSPPSTLAIIHSLLDLTAPGLRNLLDGSAASGTSQAFSAASKKCWEFLVFLLDKQFEFFRLCLIFLYKIKWGWDSNS